MHTHACARAHTPGPPLHPQANHSQPQLTAGAQDDSPGGHPLTLPCPLPSHCEAHPPCGTVPQTRQGMQALTSPIHLLLPFHWKGIYLVQNLRTNKRLDLWFNRVLLHFPMIHGVLLLASVDLMTSLFDNTIETSSGKPQVSTRFRPNCLLWNGAKTIC